MKLSWLVVPLLDHLFYRIEVTVEARTNLFQSVVPSQGKCGILTFSNIFFYVILVMILIVVHEHGPEFQESECHTIQFLSFLLKENGSFRGQLDRGCNDQHKW